MLRRIVSPEVVSNRYNMTPSSARRVQRSLFGPYPNLEFFTLCASEPRYVRRLARENRSRKIQRRLLRGGGWLSLRASQEAGEVAACSRVIVMIDRARN